MSRQLSRDEAARQEEREREHKEDESLRIFVVKLVEGLEVTLRADGLLGDDEGREPRRHA